MMINFHGAEEYYMVQCLRIYDHKLLFINLKLIRL